MPYAIFYKTKSLCFLFLAASVLLVSSCAYSSNTQPLPPNGTGIKGEIIAAVTNQSWVFSGQSQNEQFCTRLLADIQKGNFEEFTPFTVSDTYEGLELPALYNNCPDLHTPYLLYHYQIKEQCSKDFRGYMGEFDNNRENGDEFLLQCERIVYQKTDYETIDRTGELAYDDTILYRVANLKNCQHVGYTTSKGYNFNTGEESLHSGGLIIYKGSNYFLFEGITANKKTPYRYMFLSKFSSDINKHGYDNTPKSVCSFKSDIKH